MIDESVNDSFVLDLLDLLRKYEPHIRNGDPAIKSKFDILSILVECELFGKEHLDALYTECDNFVGELTSVLQEVDRADSLYNKMLGQ